MNDEKCTLKSAPSYDRWAISASFESYNGVAMIYSESITDISPMRYEISKKGDDS